MSADSLMDQATGWHKRAATGHMEPGHSTADRPVHRLLQSCSWAPPLPSESTRLNWEQPNRPDRTGRLSEPPAPRTFTETPTPPARFLPNPNPPSPIQTVAAVAERVVTPPSGGLRPPFTQPSLLRRQHFAPTPSRPVPSPSRRPESFELPRLSRRVVHRAAAAAAVTRRGGNSGAGCRDPAVMRGRGSEYGCDPAGK
jgi:hypothetical protein